MKLAWLVGLVACAHTPDLPLRPDPSPPAGSTTWTFTGGADGTQLLARTWRPPDQIGPDKSVMPTVARGVVVIMHGLKDYSARYAHFAQDLAAHGYVVYAFDLRGHGRSAGPRVAPDDWNDYVVDLDHFLAEVEKREAGKHVFLFGHSMGGAIAARTAEVHHPKLAGLILSGPAIAIDAPPLLIAITRMSGVLSPHAPALKLDNHDFSSDPANAAAMDKDELIEQGAGPAKTAAGLVAAMHDIWADADELIMPVLALHGSADKLTAPSGSRALIETLRTQDKTLRIYAGYNHDLVHEPNGNGAKVEDDIVAWLDAHTHARPPIEAPTIYAGELAGDPRGWTQAVAIQGGFFEDSGYRTMADWSHIHAALRVAVDVARPRPIGLHGGMSIHFLVAGYGTLSLRPIGVATRIGPLALGVSGGGSIMRLFATELALSSAAWFELEHSYVHLSGFAEVDHRSSSLYVFGTTVRFGGDHNYWPHVHAGWGPTLSAGVVQSELGTWAGTFFLAGIQLYGAD